ncbi:MAG: right-handed parallel beta-helix repeat-containing protein [Chitinispirillia bacterium]|nr:right-handed parallel beta-helix repeat-containing protein [Chitinispirillia bacterium]MCL2268213.1 right-handed parallel beta-helix repeat-containing protein [Chitinispirillia bacterium]
MKKNAKNTLVWAIIALIALTAAASAEVRVSGVIDRETRWKAEDGPFIIESDLLIVRRVNLTIAPGTRIIIKNADNGKGHPDQFDRADSSLISIRVLGSITSIGRRNNPITFEAETSGLVGYNWRGIILDGADAENSEIAFTEITGATTGITLQNTNILIRNNAIENCNIGIHAMNGGAPRIFNNMITTCFTAGIKVEKSNPQILNNIIAFNNNLGLWCDNSSKITFKYNCVFGNTDNNFLNCDPELGRLTRAVRGKDSTDIHGNIISDPVFIGSAAEAKAIEIDISLQTDSSRVRNTRLLSIPNLQFSSPRPPMEATIIGSENRQLSKKYSPCVEAGDPGGTFKNANGSRNTIGPSGGPDFMAR